MRIHDIDFDKSIDEVGIFLTLDEAKELRDSLEILINNPAEHHGHIYDIPAECKKQIIVAVYTKDNINMFDERSRKLIEEDK
ncbi:MAG: hypothetical protein HY746_07080 [Elusimicrobia bacterium]|nr:hypothetical protein [Elusimicrobiota bacterium]